MNPQLLTLGVPVRILLANNAEKRDHFNHMRRFLYPGSKVFLAIVVGLLGSGLYYSLRAQTAPSTYSAYTGTDTKIIPPAPALGPANSFINDPTFGSRILRVTDQNTNGGESFVSTDSGFHRTWNADSTAIKLTGPHGDGYWLEFNASTFKVGDGSSRPVLHTLPFLTTWEWSTVDPDIIYFLNGNQIGKYNKSTGVITNLGGPPTGDPVKYFAVVIGMDNWVCAAAGSGIQDTYTKIYCVNPVSPSVNKFIDVYNKTINGVPQGDPNWPTSAAGKIIGIHDIAGGTGASWLEVTFHQQSWGGNGGAVLNLATNTWSLLTNADIYWSGHVSMGNGKYVNSSGSIDGRDSRGMLVRDPNNLMNSSSYLFVGQPPNTSNGWCDSDHNSWLNSMTNPNAPILVSRFTLTSACQFAWTGEIVAAAVDGSNTVWRFAHNHNGGMSCYYADAFAQISNDGKWALFSSYWDGTLGPDTAFGCSTRIDTFIVDLSPAPVPDFTIAATPSSQTVAQGNSTSYTVTISPSNGFSGSVSFNVTGLPAGASSTFNPSSVSGSGTSTLTVTTSASTPSGTYPLTISGTSGSVVHSTSATLVVNAPADFTIGATPSSQTVVQGNSTTYTATISALNGFSGNVTFSVTGLPSAATSNFNPSSVAGNGTSTLTITTSASTPSGTYPLTITGTSGNLVHSTNATLVMNAVAAADFTIAATPSSQTVVQGNSTTYTTTISAANGFSGNVTFNVSGLPSGATSNFNPSSVAGSGTSTLTITTSTSTPSGTYSLTITGTSGSLVHSTTVTLVVNSAGPTDFTMAATPSSQTVVRGNSTTYTITISGTNGFSGNVNFSVTGLPAGTRSNFNPSSIPGNGTSTLTINAQRSNPAKEFPTGTFPLTITGTSGSVSHIAAVTLVIR